MKANRRTRYDGALDIPAASVCTTDGRRWEIRHHVTAAGEFLPLATARTMFFGNPQRGSVEFDKPVRWHHLCENGQKRMTDYPIEQAQHDHELLHVRVGSVLVGGLGLGYAAYILALRPRITKVVVVEKEAAVIHLVESALRRRLGLYADKVTVVQADLFDFLKARTLKTDWAFYDIWTSDGEGTFFETVLPLLGLSRGLVRRRPTCWNETVMRGQLAMGLRSNLWLLDEKARPEGAPCPLDQLCTLQDPAVRPGAIFHNWKVQFFRWARRNRSRRSDPRYFQAYAALWGGWDWEAQWRAFTMSTTEARRRALGLPT